MFFSDENTPGPREDLGFGAQPGLRRGRPGSAGSHATDARNLRQKRRGNGVVGAPQGGPGDAWWRVPWVGVVVDILKPKMMMECDFNGIEWMYLFGDSMGSNGDWYGLLVDMFDCLISADMVDRLYI